MTFTLTPHQEQAIQRIVNEQTRSVLCGSELGTGKTAVATESIKRWNQSVNVVTGPLHTLDGWERHFDLLNAGELRFANNKTKTGKLALSDLWFGVPGNYFLGREFARLQDWTGIEVGAWVADEALALTTPILTGRGWLTVGDVIPGDKVASPSGDMVTVKRLTEVRTDSECYQVKLASGRSITADGGHIWLAQRHKGNYYYDKPEQVTTREMAASGAPWRIVVSAAVEMPQSNLPVDPYVLGQWLGNGSRKQSYLTVRAELVDKTLREIFERGYDDAHLVDSGNKEGCRRVSLGRKFSSSIPPQVYESKSVPPEYLMGSIQQRLDLLRGLMDTDGYWGGGRSFVFTNTNLEIIDAVVKIAASLGFLVGRVGEVRDNEFTKKKCYRISFSGLRSPFLLRNTELGEGGWAKPYHRIEEIRPIASVPVRCIEVDSEDHLFLAGEMCLPTHNCHTLVNPKSRGFKAHQKNKMRTEFRMLQSATWFGSSFENAWSAARLLWPELDGYGEVADRSRYRWIDQWCRTEYDHFAPMNKRVLGERIPGKFVSEVPCYIRMESDLPELEPIVIYYDLSPVQRRIYRQMEQESLAWLSENPLVADLPVVQRIRLREIVLAEPSLNDAGEVHFESTAKSSLVSLVQEMLGDLMGEQIVMGTHSAKFARFAAPHLDNTFAWTGDKSEEQRAHAKKLFMEGSLRNILATYPAAAEGIDGWQNASHVMFELGASDNIVLAEQFRGRLNRRGQSKPVLNYRFVARDTIDDENYDSLLSRELEMRRSVALDMAHASN